MDLELQMHFCRELEEFDLQMNMIGKSSLGNATRLLQIDITWRMISYKVSCLMKLPVLIGIQVSIELSNFCSSW